MIRRTHALLFTVLIAMITIYAVRRVAGPAVPQPVGRYFGQRAIDRATPICRAMLPHRDDLYAGVEETWGATSNKAAHAYWDVAFSDRQGNKLIHVIGDADSGVVRRVKRMKGPTGANSGSAIPDHDVSPLSARQAVECAHAWMRTLGFAEDWQLASAPRPDASRWQVRLRSNGMIACLDLDLQHGSLLFADITPER